MTTYFISDIHLHANSSENSRLLLNFLEKTGPHADAIYILGDLFAIWFGDDLNLHLPYVSDLICALRKLADRRVPVYFMHGNRDFLVGKKFCQETHCSLLADPFVIKLYNQPVLLTHGDLLCSQDLKYQKFRKLVQNPLVKAWFLSLPKTLRLKIGNWVKRKATRSTNYPVQADLFDATPATVSTWMEQHDVKFLIHGHTHNPEIHKTENTTRIVLGDWNENTAKILAFSSNGFELQDLRAL